MAPPPPISSIHSNWPPKLGGTLSSNDEERVVGMGVRLPSASSALRMAAVMLVAGVLQGVATVHFVRLLQGHGAAAR
jgi:hypothetical protein